MNQAKAAGIVNNIMEEVINNQVSTLLPSMATNNIEIANSLPAIKSNSTDNFLCRNPLFAGLDQSTPRKQVTDRPNQLRDTLLNCDATHNKSTRQTTLGEYLDVDRYSTPRRLIENVVSTFQTPMQITSYFDKPLTDDLESDLSKMIWSPRRTNPGMSTQIHLTHDQIQNDPPPNTAPVDIGTTNCTDNSLLSESDLNSTLHNLAICNQLNATHKKRKYSGSYVPLDLKFTNKSTQTSEISVNYQGENQSPSFSNYSNRGFVVTTTNSNHRTVQLTNNKHKTNPFLINPIQELSKENINYDIIPDFQLDEAQMDVWRKLRSCSSNTLKYRLRSEHLDRCIESNITPPWALKLEPWNIDFTETEKTKFVELEKCAAKDRMTLLQTVLNDREQSENLKTESFEKALKGMLGEDNSKLSASDKVLSQLLKKEEASQLSNYIKREGKWRDSPVQSTDIFTALSKGPKMSTTKPNPPTLGNNARVANPTNNNHQQNNFQNQRPSRGNPYNRGRGSRSGFRGGRNQDPTSLGQNRPSSSAAKQPTEHNVTPEEKRFLEMYRKYLQPN